MTENEFVELENTKEIDKMNIEIFEKIKNNLTKEGFIIHSSTLDRPWGGFFVILESQSDRFIETYFKEKNSALLTKRLKVSPKILIVCPEKRLSWQFHHRRSEVWIVVEGEVGVVTSDNDEEGELKILQVGDTIVLKCGERHRLIGLEDYAVVAEIWQHTNINFPSDELDIVRVQDDFGR